MLAGCGVSLREPGARPEPAAEARGAAQAQGASSQTPVPRIEVEQAYAEVMAGRAILVDVRGPASYNRSHAEPALELSLDRIEQSPAAAVAALPAGLLPIFYCT